MLQGLISQNLEQNPHKVSDLKKMNICVGLTVSDVEIDMTMDFRNGALTLHTGLIDKPEVIITGESGTIMAMSNLQIKWGMPYYFDENGREILKAMMTRKLKIKGMILNFTNMIRLTRILSVN